MTGPSRGPDADGPVPDPGPGAAGSVGPPDRDGPAERGGAADDVTYDGVPGYDDPRPPDDP